MATQINLKFQDNFYKLTKDYAKVKGYMSIQELVREALRDKIFEDLNINESYLKKLESSDATTFIDDEQADQIDKELEIQAKLG